MFWERFYNMCVAQGTKPNPLAKEIGVSSGIVTKWKTAGTLPNGETLIKLANRLDCSIDYLVGRSDTPYMLKDENVELLSPEELELVRKFRERNR